MVWAVANTCCSCFTTVGQVGQVWARSTLLQRYMTWQAVMQLEQSSYFGGHTICFYLSCTSAYLQGKSSCMPECSYSTQRQSQNATVITANKKMWLTSCAAVEAIFATWCFQWTEACLHLLLLLFPVRAAWHVNSVNIQQIANCSVDS